MTKLCVDCIHYKNQKRDFWQTLIAPASNPVPFISDACMAHKSAIDGMQVLTSAHYMRTFDCGPHGSLWKAKP